MRKLPPELSIAIFSYLPNRDLPAVIRISPTCRDIGRPLLYQSVDLRSDDTHIRSTVDLLQKNTDLSKIVKDATLTTVTRRSSTTSWIPANFLKGWDDLRSLKMIGVPFYTTKDQEIFRDTLMSSCTSLAHFTYRPGANSFPGPDFGISSLKLLSWQVERATPIDEQILSVMKSSINTLTHISFTGHLSLLQPTYYEFLDLRFPHLTSLELGSLFQTASQELSESATTRFIIAHPSIYHLSLGKSRIGPTTFQFQGTQLGEDSLPNLRSFEGFPTNITLLVQRNVRSLLELTTLSLSSDIDDDLSAMFETVKTRLGSLGSGQFPCVRNLRFEFPTDLTHRMETNLSVLAHRRCLDGFSEICPAVINWYGRLGPVNQGQLANLFSVYDHLETINLPILCLNLNIPPDETGINSYFRTIAERLPKLQQVVARKPAYTDLTDQVFCLRRASNSDFDSVYVRYQDGCEDPWKLVDEFETSVMR